MKWLRHIVNTILWLLGTLYLSLAIIANIPAVQGMLGSRVASALAKKLGTKVWVGRVDLGLLNRVIIDDITVLDQRGKDMLRANRVSATIDLMALAEGHIEISSAQLFGLKAQLYKANEKAKPNYQFVVDSLASKDTTQHSSLDFRIRSIVIRRGAVAFDQWDKPERKGFDTHHLRLSGISTHILVSDMKPDLINVSIKKLAMAEHCGLEISSLKGKLHIGTDEARLERFLLVTPTSRIALPKITATFKRHDGKIMTESVRAHGTLASSTISSKDVACFVPALHDLDKVCVVSGLFSGSPRQLAVDALSLSVGDRLSRKSLDLSLRANASLEKAGGVWHWNTAIKSLTINKTGIALVAKKVPAIEGRIERLAFRGKASGLSKERIALSGHLLSDAGNATLAFSMRGTDISGKLSTPLFNLKQVTANDKLGLATLDINASGNMKRKAFRVDGTIDRLDYNGYPYRNLYVKGALNDGTLTGRLVADDPNLAATITSTKGINLKGKQIGLTAQVKRFAPAKLNLMKGKLGNAVYSVDLKADIRGNNVNNLDGMLLVNNLNVHCPQGEYQLQSLQLKAGQHGGEHYLTMWSDFGHAEVTGHFNYATLIQGVKNVIIHQIPSLQKITTLRYEKGPSNNFALNATITRDDWLHWLTGLDLQLQQPVSLTCSLDNLSEQLNLHLTAPELTFNGTQYNKLNLVTSSPSNRMTLMGSVTMLNDKGVGTDYQLQASAIGDEIVSQIRMDNHALERRLRGEINASVGFDKNLNHQTIASAHLMSSKISVGDSVFHVKADQLEYANKRMRIDNLSMASNTQYATINGYATTSNGDSLTIDMHRLNVEYILDLVNFHSVDFSGYMSGTAFVSGLFGTPSAHGKVSVENFKFEGGDMGTLLADVNWNNNKKQIDIDAQAIDTLMENGRTLPRTTTIYGNVSPKRNDINLEIDADQTRGAFLAGFCSNFMSDIDLTVNGKLRLWGSLSKLNLTGGVKADGQTTITPINTRYTLKDDSIRLLVNEIQFVSDTIYDHLGNHGVLTGSLFHNHLSHLSYDLDIKARNLLGYDFNAASGNTVYGTIAGTGDINIKGKPGELNINVNATPTPGAVFVYDITSPEDIGTQDFINWVSRDSIIAHMQRGKEPRPMANDNGWDDMGTDIHINFLIHATPQATLKLIMDKASGDYITLNGEGTIRASYYNKGGVDMYGTYRVDDGIYKLTIQNIIKRDFTFTRGGTITFNGDPNKAMLRLKAQYQINSANLADLQLGRSFSSNNIRVNCLMNITGTPSDPKVDFDLDMPTVSTDIKQMIYSIINSEEEMNQQVLYLLAVGRFYNKTGNNAQDAESSENQASLAMQSILSGQVSQQINNVLGTVVNNKNWNFGANISTGTEGWNNAEYEGILSGSLLNNRLLFNGQFGYRDNATNATQSFIGDFDIRYLIYPNGNLSVRVYNQTNDRYFTRNTLNTQGIGFVIKRDFNNWKDLWKRTRKKSDGQQANATKKRAAAKSTDNAQRANKNKH